MDKFTKEDYREYLVYAHESLEKRLSKVVSLDPSIGINIMRLDFEILRELYKLDKE